MSPATFFYQECPVCGRSLRVAVKYFGREMACGHCHGEFVARPRENVPLAPVFSSVELAATVGALDSAALQPLGEP